jgi:hypothetical protein
MSSREQGAWEQLRLQLLGAGEEWQEIFLEAAVKMRVTIHRFGRSKKKERGVNTSVDGTKGSTALVGVALTQHFGGGKWRKEHHLAYDDFILTGSSGGSSGDSSSEDDRADASILLQHAAVRASLMRMVPYLLRQRIEVVVIVSSTKRTKEVAGGESAEEKTVECGSSTLAKFGSSSEYYDLEDYTKLVNQWYAECPGGGLAVRPQPPCAWGCVGRTAAGTAGAFP